MMDGLLIDSLYQVARHHDVSMYASRDLGDFGTTIRVWKGFVKPDGAIGIASKTYILSDLDVVHGRVIGMPERQLRRAIDELNAFALGQS